MNKNTIRDSYRALKFVLLHVRSDMWMFLPTQLVRASEWLFFNLIIANLLSLLMLMLDNKDISGLWPLILRFGLFFAVLLGVTYIASVTASVLRARICMRMQHRLFSHIVHLRASSLESTHSGEFIARLDADVDSSSGLLSTVIYTCLAPLVSGIGGIIAVIYVDWRMAAFACCFGMLVAVLCRGFILPMKEASDKERTAYGESNTRFSDLLSGGAATRVYHIGMRLAEKYAAGVDEAKKWAMKRQYIFAWMTGFYSAVGLLSSGGMILFGTYLVYRGELTPDRVMYAVIMGGTIVWMFESLATMLADMQKGTVAADRMIGVLELPSETETEAEDVRPQCSDNAVCFENVDFFYNEADGTVLKGLGFSAACGDTTAIVGPSGGGKSTVLKLLLGLYSPAGGRITVFGRDIGELSAQTLRSLCAYVPQQGHLFNLSVYENIALGRPGASREEIEKAARDAFAHEFIMELPEGYDSRVGERGVHLSGGQRQRIVIARAFLKNAPLLLLDEATSSLDSESEEKVQAALHTLMENRTTIVIAHRLSTVRNADTILVIEEGRVTQRGTHQELVEAGGMYESLHCLEM